VETIDRVRHAFHVKGKKIKQIARELRLARNTVRTIVRGDETNHSYERKAQPLPKLGAFAVELDRLLEDNATRPRRERLTFQRLYCSVSAFGQHQPLNRQSERYARERIDLSVSTLADQVGDDTTVPILAKGKTVTGHIWTYVSDDGPFGGTAPTAALYYASRDRRQEHPARHLQSYTSILQADAYSGYNGLYDGARLQGLITTALCWAHARRKFFELADVAANPRRGKKAISPIALEAVKRIDALFDIERSINGVSAAERLEARRQRSAPLLADLKDWLHKERAGLSRSASVTKPIDYMLKRWDRFAGLLDDGRICLSNNAAERALRGFALGRKSWLFAGSERGADRAAAITTLIMTAKNRIDPLAWLADVLACIAEMPNNRLPELLPWEWKRQRLTEAA